MIDTTGIDTSRTGYVEKDGEFKVHYVKQVNRKMSDGRSMWLDAPACGARADLMAFVTIGGYDVTCSRCMAYKPQA